MRRISIAKEAENRLFFSNYYQARMVFQSIILKSADQEVVSRFLNACLNFLKTPHQQDELWKDLIDDVELHFEGLSREDYANKVRGIRMNNPESFEKYPTSRGAKVYASRKLLNPVVHIEIFDFDEEADLIFEVISEAIYYVLKLVDFRKKMAADILGVTKKTFLKYLKERGIGKSYSRFVSKSEHHSLNSEYLSLTCLDFERFSIKAAILELVRSVVIHQKGKSSHFAPSIKRSLRWAEMMMYDLVLLIDSWKDETQKPPLLNRNKSLARGEKFKTQPSGKVWFAPRILEFSHLPPKDIKLKCINFELSDRPYQDIEQEFIYQCFRSCNSRVDEVASLLKMSSSGISNLVRKYRLRTHKRVVVNSSLEALHLSHIQFEGKLTVDSLDHLKMELTRLILEVSGGCSKEGRKLSGMSEQTFRKWCRLTYDDLQSRGD